MKTKIKFFILFLIAFISIQSCQDQDDTLESIIEPVSEELAINNFIWKGLNLYYLWQADVPNLADNRFANQADYYSFLRSYNEPENLFQSLLYKPASRFPDNEAIDRFSWIESDYVKLEGELSGNTKNNGLDYGLYLKSSGSNEIFGWTRYIIANSNAANKNIQRGAIFYGINGVPLTTSNYQSLLNSTDTYDLNLADFNNGAITPNGKTITLTKTDLAENPILINKVINSGGHKIGYLMYNGFYSDYDNQLNTAFGTLKSQGITDFVLDLRYNSGGSVQSATRLASMITGQNTGKVFAKQRWNDKIEAYYKKNNPESLLNLFTDKIGTTPINNIKMTTVYILTSKRTASASELVINGLKPFINVVQIGDITVGKNVGSVTLYDSPTFGPENRNKNHHYAMQPIVIKTENSVGFGDYQTGLVPNYVVMENLANLDELGSPTEPLLRTAISKITGINRYAQPIPGIQFKNFSDSKSLNGLQNQMYLEKAPEDLMKAL